ncbi:hypothetical protein ACFSCW_06770 [Sphingomonas tabacisoli]|uniref:Uncharacterized protein n=1 Tax=Sphingomonas tabacisoli TaxID=2249466 RepID=A0ABW4I0P1_9SPHN
MEGTAGEGLAPLRIGDKSYLTGVMHVDQRTKAARIAFDQAQEDDFAEALLGLDLSQVAANSREKLKLLQEQGHVQQLFRTGPVAIKYPLKPSQPLNLVALGQEPERAANLKTQTVGQLFVSEDLHPAPQCAHQLGLGVNNDRG